MQSRENQMASERGLHSGLRGFSVANFSNHDDVGILSKKRSECARKCESRFDIHLRLMHAG